MFLLPFSLLEELLCIYPQSGRVASSVRCCLWCEGDLFRKVRLVLGSQEKGRAWFGRGLMPGWWHRRQLAPGIWCKTTCKNVGPSEQVHFLSFSEMTPPEGGFSPVSAEHWSSHRSNGEGIGATLLSHITFIEFPITRVMVSVCDDLRKMLIVVNCLLVRKVGNHWPNVCLWGQGDLFPWIRAQDQTSAC